ncbi:MAG: hypothetical protein H6523_09925 [Mycolicibacterium sp.]|nr:hypothetical protein [Mycolicibacterium sp.]
MDVMLGVAVDGDRGQIAMLDAGPGHAVIDEAVVLLGEQSVDELIARLVATDRSLGDDGHRLVSTRVCCEDPDVAAAISGGLTTAGLANVAAVSASEAVSGAMPVHGETAALSLGTGSLAQEVALTGASESLLSAEASAATGMAPAVDVMATGVAPVVDSGATSMAPAMDSDATSMAPATGDETMVVPAGTDPLLNTERQQLAYSLDPDLEPAGEATAYGPAAAAEAGYVDTGYGDYDDYGYEDGYEEEPEQRDRRPLLIGSTVAAFMIVGFATLAVSVAVSIKPTSSSQALRLQDDAVPGKYFPVAPGQGVQPDGNAWTMIEEAPATGAAVGTPAVRTFQPLALGPSTQTAAQTAAQTVRVYPDGAMTVGGAPVPAVTPAVPTPGTNVGVGAIGAVPGVIVPQAPLLTSLIIGNVLREAVQLGPLNPNNYNTPPGWNTKPKPGDQFNVDPSGSAGASTPGVSSPESKPESGVSSPASPGESPESTPSSASASSEASPTPSTRASESETTPSTRASESSTKQSEPESTANSTPKASESVPSSASRSAEQSPAESPVQSPVQSPVHESPAVESPAESPAVQSPAVQSPAAASPVEQAPASVEQAPVVHSPVQQAPVQQQQQAPVQQSVQEAPAEAPSRSGRSPSVSLPTTESSGGGIFGGGSGSGGYGRGGGIFGGGSGN